MEISVREWRNDGFNFIEATTNDEGGIAFKIETKDGSSLVCTLTDQQATFFLNALVSSMGIPSSPQTRPKNMF